MRPVTLYLLPLLFQFIAQTIYAQPSPIRINQEGYYLGGPKTAIITSETSIPAFYIINEASKDTAYSGRPGKPQPSKNSSLICQSLDFTNVSKPGRYLIYIPGIGNSYPFSINSHPLYSTAVSSLKGFYYQRVSTPLESPYAAKWARPAGHPDTKILIHPSAATAERPAGAIVSSPGGWYDAGDYNKYVVNSGITMGTLLSAYEDFPKYFDTLKTNIPESSNNIPDLLDEILINLRWMLTMQDPNDGGVYHKCTNAAFDGMVMPGATTLPRYMVQKSTAATLDFAAVTAQSARIFKAFSKQLPGLSDSCLSASLLAYTWAMKNPSMRYNQNAMNKQFSPPITTGAYGDNNLWDEWAWASSELYITTSENKFIDSIGTGMNHPVLLASWSQVAYAGFYSLIRNEKKLPASSTPMISKLKIQLIHFADSLLENQKTNAFHVVIGGSKRDFEWGSNAVAANQGIILINAYNLTKNKDYLNGAISNADYLLGRNATGYCFLTGAGSFSTMRPHHRPSVADGIDSPVPGLLAGGPNPGKQDKCNYAFSEPETTYLDEDCSFASNEIAINWNAPLVYLLNSIEFMLNSKK